MFWIDCRTGIEAGFADIYDLLHPGHEQSVPTDIRAKRALHELEQPGAEQSLLIVDNAEDEQSILPWIPKTGDCHVLITSRFTAWSKEVTKHEVWVLDPEPAKELLLKLAGLKADDAADEVAQTLGYLPLALEQAAAYVAQQTGFTFRDYLRLYRQNEKAFLDRKAEGATNYPDSVYLTWRTTIDKLPEGARTISDQSVHRPTRRRIHDPRMEDQPRPLLHGQSRAERLHLRPRPRPGGRAPRHGRPGAGSCPSGGATVL
jgi:hypothetical protein